MIKDKENLIYRDIYRKTIGFVNTFIEISP